MRNSLNPGSYVILGASESLPAAISELYKMERLSAHTSVYRT